MTTVTGADVQALYTTDTMTHAVLTDHDDAIAVAERTACRSAGWPILAYRSDLVEAWPNGLSPEQSDSVAEQINDGRAAKAAALDPPTD